MIQTIIDAICGSFGAALMMGFMFLSAFIFIIVLPICAGRVRWYWFFITLIFGPIGALLFAIRHWPEAKKPFLWGIAAFTGGIGMFILRSFLAIFFVPSTLPAPLPVPLPKQTATPIASAPITSAPIAATETNAPAEHKQISTQCDAFAPITKGTAAVVFVIDKSRSMAEGEKMPRAQQAVKDAIAKLSDSDLAGVIGFDFSPFVIVRLEPLSSSRANILKRLKYLTTASRTNVFPALEEAHKQLAGIGAERKHIIVVFDGPLPPTDQQPHYQLWQRMNDSGVTLSIVQIGSDASATLKELATASCGQFYQVAENGIPEAVVADLTNHVRAIPK